MQTNIIAILDKGIKEKYKVITQPYIIGILITVYNEHDEIMQQFAIDENEKKYHKNLRKKFKTWR